MTPAPTKLPVGGSSVKCARRACPNTANVVFRHRQTGDRYCPRCAKRINEGTPGLVVREKGKG